jgi:hypothetical protein
VERAIRYVRESFFAGRTFTMIDDLNAQAHAWCAGQAADRRCPGDHTLRVGEAFAHEQVKLLPLPDNPFATDENVIVKVGKTPYIRFDRNDYSIPHTQVQRSLTVCADPERVRVLWGTEVLASHPRSYDRGAQIEDPSHIAGLIDHKRQARQHRGANRLTHALPQSADLLKRAAERGYHLGTLTRDLWVLLDQYGAAECQRAIDTALTRDVPHQHAVRLALEQQRDARTPPPIGVALPAHVQRKDTPIQPHPLNHYDHLTPPTETAHDTPANP